MSPKTNHASSSKSWDVSMKCKKKCKSRCIQINPLTEQKQPYVWENVLNQAVSECGWLMQLFVQQNKNLTTIRHIFNKKRIHRTSSGQMFYLFQMLSFPPFLFFSLRLSTDFPQWRLLTVIPLLVSCFLSPLCDEMLNRSGSAVASLRGGKLFL